MSEAASLQLVCPYCADAVELSVDDVVEARQSYVEDCPVCCRPWQVELVRNANGKWEAVLLTEDE